MLNVLLFAGSVAAAAADAELSRILHEQLSDIPDAKLVLSVTEGQQAVRTLPCDSNVKPRLISVSPKA